jgi:hypothetical protein
LDVDKKFPPKFQIYFPVPSNCHCICIFNFKPVQIYHFSKFFQFQIKVNNHLVKIIKIKWYLKVHKVQWNRKIRNNSVEDQFMQIKWWVIFLIVYLLCSLQWIRESWKETVCQSFNGFSKYDLNFLE